MSEPETPKPEFDEIIRAMQANMDLMVSEYQRLRTVIAFWVDEVKRLGGKIEAE